MESVEQVLQEHPFLTGASLEYARLVAGCARDQRFQVGEYLFNEGGHANEFFLIRDGKVALEIAAPGRAPVVFESLDTGDFVGASWLTPPYRWVYDARAVEFTRAIRIDAACLRSKCEADHDFGYEMMKRFLRAVVKRLHASHLQVLDVYGNS